MAETVKHSTMTGVDAHSITRWVVADAASLPTTLEAADLHKVAYTQDTKTYYGLVSVAPVEWRALGSSANPVVNLEVVGSDLIVTFEDESTATLPLPSGGGSVDLTSLQPEALANPGISDSAAGTLVGPFLRMDGSNAPVKLLDPYRAYARGTMSISLSTVTANELRVVGVEAMVSGIQDPDLSQDFEAQALGIDTPTVDGTHGWIALPWEFVGYIGQGYEVLGTYVEDFPAPTTWDAANSELIGTRAGPPTNAMGVALMAYVNFSSANIVGMRAKVKSPGFTAAQLLTDVDLLMARLCGPFWVSANLEIELVSKTMGDLIAQGVEDAGDGEHVYVYANFGPISDYTPPN